MHVEIFTLCDAATVDGAGKLNILGSFDRLSAASEPIVHMQCALALKLRFARIEEGQKRFRLTFVDSDGKAVMQPLETTAKNYFRVAHWEATVKGSSMKALRALSRRSVNSSGVRAMKSVK